MGTRRGASRSLTCAAENECNWRTLGHDTILATKEEVELTTPTAPTPAAAAVFAVLTLIAVPAEAVATAVAVEVSGVCISTM